MKTLIQTQASAQYYKAEDAVADLLREKGHIILAKNFAIAGVGEIDIISMFQSKFFVIEVKARQTTFEAEDWTLLFNRQKKRKIIRCFYYYLQRSKQIDREFILLAACVQWNRAYEIQDIQIHFWEE